MNRLLQAALLTLAAVIAFALPACNDDPPPTDPGDGQPSLTISTCLDCHSDEDALKASVAAVAAAPEHGVVAAGDG